MCHSVFGVLKMVTSVMQLAQISALFNLHNICNITARRIECVNGFTKECRNACSNV